jgi:WD40 repeat protein
MKVHTLANTAAAVLVALVRGPACYGQEPKAILHTKDKVALSVDFSPDGRTLAVGCQDGSVELWEMLTGRRRARCHGTAGLASPVKFADHRSLLVGSPKEGVVRLLDIPTGKVLASFRGQGGPPFSLVIRRDRRLLALGGRDGTVVLWDAATAKVRARLRGDAEVRKPSHAVGSNHAVAFSRDGGQLTSARQDGMVFVWDVTTGKQKARLDLRPALQHRRGFRRSEDNPEFLWSRGLRGDGQLLACSGRDGTVLLWDVPAGTLRATFGGHTQIMNAFAFSGDGRWLASAGVDDTVGLWDVAAGRAQAVLRGHDGCVMDVAFSPDGRTLASAGQVGTVRIWSIAALLSREAKAP